MIGIILLAFLLRVWQLPSIPPGLYPDEAMNGNNALEALKTGEWKVFYPENNGREGLFINIQALALLLTGEREPWALRFPSAVFGTLTVLGAFFLFFELAKLSRLTTPFFVASFGSLFLALSHWHLIFSRIGFRAIMAPFFVTWAVYFFLVAVRSHKFRYALLSGISLGLGAYSYIAYRIMPLVFLPLLLQFWRRRGFQHLALGVALSAVIVFIPLGLYFLENPADFLGRTAQVSVFSSDTLPSDLMRNIGLTIGMFFIRGDANWRHNFAGEPTLFLPVAVLFLIGAGLAARERTVFDKVFVLWLLLAAVPVVTSNEGLPHALRAILMIPAMFAFVGRGAAWCATYVLSHLPKFQAALVCAVFIVTVFFYTHVGYFHIWAKNPETAGAFAKSYVEIGREINALPPGEEKYIVVRARGIDVRGIPMPTQTVMFITDSFLPEDQNQKHIYYVTDDEYALRAEALGFHHLFVID